MIYVDSLLCSPLERETPDHRPALDQIAAGEVGCVVTTVGFWEDATESMDQLVKWRHMAEDNADLVEIAYTAGDIRRIADSGRCAIVLGFQNVSFLQGRLGYVELFARMGTRVGQLTYNIQSDIGGSCYEPHDSGLSRYGKYVVREMNRCGMVVDLSHVGNTTTLDAIRHSAEPVAITHSNPHSWAPHPRNKPDEVLDALKDNGGVIGLSVYRNIVGEHTTAEKWSEMVAWTVDRIGIEHVGIGTDFDQTGGMEYVSWMRQGRWARETQYGAGSKANPGKAPKLDWFASPADFPNAEQALRARGFDDREVALLMGENWLNFFDRTFKEL
ncbi:dipeptidase [Sediminivirga luteola]|uniref:Dipeptidase n=1 Tax=Sediminivirga luteola TaxID=1774748 RepID=A0A8J2XKF9_9MICO|nr:membrane dipeptidase [Sediminivirga luteola]MCI2265847.1 membrane dipeptidase [Sediminivirga luteola]GGA14161.1 dipeptidase [Sediminivirga luteola]